MVRNTAREIAMHLSYELSFTDKSADALLERRLTCQFYQEMKVYIGLIIRQFLYLFL